MADHTQSICENWHGTPGDKVTFVNNTAKACVISQYQSNPWPFKDGPPIPATGPIPPGGSATTHLKNPLGKGAHYYDVDCCANRTPKNVTVP